MNSFSVFKGVLRFLLFFYAFICSIMSFVVASTGIILLYIFTFNMSATQISKFSVLNSALDSNPVVTIFIRSGLYLLPTFWVFVSFYIVLRYAGVSFSGIGSHFSSWSDVSKWLRPNRFSSRGLVHRCPVHGFEKCDNGWFSTYIFQLISFNTHVPNHACTTDRSLVSRLVYRGPRWTTLSQTTDLASGGKSI